MKLPDDGAGGGYWLILGIFAFMFIIALIVNATQKKMKGESDD